MEHKPSSSNEEERKRVRTRTSGRKRADAAIQRSEEESSDEQYGRKQTPVQPLKRLDSAKDTEEEAGDKHKRYYWDIMQDTREKDHEPVSYDRMWDRVYVALKVIVCIFLFLFVLTTAVVSKLCLVLVTSNLFPPMNNIDPYWMLKTANYSIRYPIDKTNVQWIWALFFIISAPYFFTVLSSGWQLLFKKESSSPGWNGIAVVMALETLHSLGLCMLVFVVLPGLDPIACVLICFQVAGLPGLLGAIGRPTRQTRARIIRVVLISCVLLQIAAIGLTCGYYVKETQMELKYLHALFLVLAPILVSLSWWENYLNLDGEKDSLSSKFAHYIIEIQNRRKKFNITGNVWKIFITFIFPQLVFGIPCQNGMECINALFGNSHNLSAQNGVMNSSVGNTIFISAPSFLHCNNYLPLLVAVVSIVCSGLCYKAAKIACTILAQIACMTLPLAISSPVAIGALMGYMARNVQGSNQTCNLPFPYWSDENHKMTEYVKSSYYWMIIVAGICGYVSFLIISYHTWLLGKKRLQKSEQLFAKSGYCGVLLCQSIPLNRKRMEEDNVTGKETSTAIQGPSTKEKASSVTPLVYICATMWHETKSEMKKLMQSILRLDEDQRNRSYFRDLVGDFDDDFFNFEVHIFFDDAFRTDIIDGTKRIRLNAYVTDLLEVVQETTGHDNCLKTKLKKKFQTHYGGRLEWDLPYGNKMIAHLKNKEKIRVRKRWSQVMYMYYFLGYKILGEAYKTIKSIDKLIQDFEENKSIREQACNTFILALDGDVDFKPEAVKYLMDRMKKYPNVGAACGRIHPTGNGPMVWYQKFEYAVSHWLQKVAEDKMGCVLCSPGCFSLFRGSALMDKNVMKVYTTPPTTGRHHVQYDQGEDRWLCTLLLQQGYRVEYVAASDALTEAPVGFNEFFNQRRRWTPSTMANILDLLLDWRHVIKQNPDISTMYIFYQTFLMFSSILTPGTIFLMLIGAINTAYTAIDLWVVLLLNLVPLVVFIALCFNAKSETQLTFAGLLSIAYSLVMMLVLIGLAITIVDHGFCSVTAIFFIFVAGVFVISALLHPQEFSCIFHGFLYFLAIPATSVVMVLYSLCNLNVTSWGTRESTQTSSGNDTGKSGNPRNWFDVSRGSLRCLCCSQETDQGYILQRLDQLEGQLIQQGQESSSMENTAKSSPNPTDITADHDDLKLFCDGFPMVVVDETKFIEFIFNTDWEVDRKVFHRLYRSSVRSKLDYGSIVYGSACKSCQQMFGAIHNQKKFNEIRTSYRSHTPLYTYGLQYGEKIGASVATPHRNISSRYGIKQSSNSEIVRYDWIRDEKLLKSATRCQLDEDEKKFWRSMIKRYLFPLVQTDEDKLRVEVELTGLRNNVCLFFILANAMFISIIFTLQQITTNTKSLSIPLPCFTSSGKVDYVEPISLTFTVIFGIILLAQFICMLLHRFGTLVHICARTEIFKFKMDFDDKTNMMQLFYDLARKNQKTEHQNQAKNILKPNTVKPKKDDRHSKDLWKKVREHFMPNSFADKCQTLVTFVTEMQKRKVPLNRDQVMVEIRQKFPGFSSESYMAIARMISDQDIASRSNKLIQGSPGQRISNGERKTSA